jgi:RNA polymerase sigma factor (sigma-70 family)
MVERIALQVHRKMTHLDIEDLEQAGYIGLLEAWERYRPETGIFAAYAFFRVRGAMIDAHKRKAYREDTHGSLEETLTESDDLCRCTAIDGALLPDAMAARSEQARLLNAAVNELDPDERTVFCAALGRISLINTAHNTGHTVAWTRAKLASARLQLGAKVHMWGLGLDTAA